MILLRPDQKNSVDAIKNAFRSTRNVIFVAPTGTGKTAVASHLMRTSVERGHRPGFLTNREEIALDTVARNRASGARVGMLMADEPADASAPMQVISIPTLMARGISLADLNIDFAIWDECHHAASSTWTAARERLPNAWHLGLTATPERGDGQALSMFKSIVHGPTTRWCIDHGHLVQPVLVGPPEHLGARLICTPLEAYEDHAPDSRAIIFCASVEHVRQTTAAFNAAGIAAEGIVADTDRATRRSMRERLTAGTTRVLVGCGVFLEGFDCAAIDCVILARSFSTVGSYLQAIGRGLRPCAATGKRSCTVLDLAGSAHQCGFGLPDEDRTWSLDGDASRRTEPLPALSRCAECMAIFRPTTSCPRCGAVRTALARVPRVLNRAERLQRIEHIPVAARDAAYLRKLQHVATSRMRLTGRFAEQWAARAFEKRFHRAPAMDVSTAHGSTHRAPATGGTA